MAISLTAAADIQYMALKYFIRGGALSQTTQDKPLLRTLKEKQKTFPSGNSVISLPVQGAFMSDVGGFFAGYSESDALTFTTATNVLRAEYNWFETHAGLVISETELKKDGISVNDSMKTSEHSQTELTRLMSILENRVQDYGESYSRQKNLMLWKDGTQDAKQVPGIQSILTQTPATGTTGGLNRATYAWWRHRYTSALQPSAANSTLTKFLRKEWRQLRRFGGKPDIALCGSAFIEALELEVWEKGLLTQEGFANEGKTDFGMAKIRMKGLGTFEYDPTMDDLGLTKECFIIDGRRLRLMPMQGEEDKVRHPERPYDQMVYLQSMTWTGGLVCDQLNCHGRYTIA